MWPPAPLPAEIFHKTCPDGLPVIRQSPGLPAARDVSHVITSRRMQLFTRSACAGTLTSELIRNSLCAVLSEQARVPRWQVRPPALLQKRHRPPLQPAPLRRSPPSPLLRVRIAQSAQVPTPLQAQFRKGEAACCCSLHALQPSLSHAGNTHGWFPSVRLAVRLASLTRVELHQTVKLLHASAGPIPGPPGKGGAPGIGLPGENVTP